MVHGDGSHASEHENRPHASEQENRPHASEQENRPHAHCIQSLYNPSVTAKLYM